MDGKKIRIGVLGCSNFLRNRIIEAVKKCEYCEIVCLASRNVEKAKSWSEEFGIESYGNYESLLRREDIDAVYVSLPIGLHKEWTIKSANAGKHVLCEKALAESLESVKEMIESCKMNKVKLSENIMIKFHPQHNKVFDMVNEGKIGEVFSVKSSFGHPPLDEKDIRYDKNLNNGVMEDLACYPIFISTKIFAGNPVSVNCSLQKDENGNEIRGHLELEFENGRVCLADFGFDNFYQNKYEVWGSEGLLRVNRAYPIDEMKPDIDYEHGFDEKDKVDIDGFNQYTKSFDEFCLDILEDRDSDFEGMLNLAKIMESLRISAKEVRKVKLSEIENKKKVVVVSGYFDPIHNGHLELMEKARSLGDKLIVIVNNDKQVNMKRGKDPFMNENDRKKLVESIRLVDEAFISIDTDRSVVESLREINPDIFANGGDRNQGEVPETPVCRELGIEMVDGQGEKIATSRDYYLNN
jgi:cytidyltransferase-like protein